MTRLPRHQPGGRATFRIGEQPKWNATVMVVLPPRVRPRGAEIFRARHRGCPFVLLLLDLGDLVRILVAAVPLISVPASTTSSRRAHHKPPRLGSEPRRRRLCRRRRGRRLCAARGVAEQLLLARALGMFPGGPVDETVGVGRRLAVAEVGRVATPADAARHARLLNRLADQHAVFFKLFRENSVEERIAAGIQWQNKHSEHLEEKQINNQLGCLHAPFRLRPFIPIARLG